ncbi:glycoside hydrolase family 43 protein [Sphingobacterium sp. SRCM116780]|uniref:glycoside hydrolase family 43 protein n=1 Tax=Sphingobacterium sp. SRCM116780 TaxID=2907623 RepID=UPI001F33DAF9|nr:glycoside hydrolase family 43 protein [Sphingobacterium sp. SRCM116780]UIR57415.1 glycoside hydrolase family 43 protein [Sphingobacterium sp. SRCM116780]
MVASKSNFFFFIFSFFILGIGFLNLGCRVLPDQNHEWSKVDSSNQGLFQADPTVFYHDGYYYLYGTNGDQDTILGFKVYRSQDLAHWEGPVGVNNGFVLRKGDSFGTTGFWAPQVWYEKGKFYMAYTANENIAIATSDSPIGPFKQTTSKPLINTGKQIDPFVFTDSNGKKYLYHVRLDKGNRIVVAELKADYSGIKEETLKECLHASLPWENTAQASWPVVEGPTVLLKDNKYYLFYSANDFRNPDYAVGVAVADNVYGPWKRIGTQPLLSKANSKWSGTGHGDVFKKDNQWYYVCHTHYSENKVAPRRSAIVPFHFDKQKDGVSVPVFDGNKFSLIKTDTNKNSAYATDVAFGDPFILYDRKSDTYYLYGTGGTANGFMAYSSKDLKNWKKERKVYDGNQPKAWGIKDFWAPEVYQVNNKYYIYYSAHWKENPNQEQENYRIGVAVADHPLGPFIDITGSPIFDPGYPIIDANVFRDEDHRNYLFFSRCCYEHPVESEIATWAKKKLGYKAIEESWVYGVELDSSLSKVIGAPKLLIKPPQSMNDDQSEWESRSVTSGEINRRWTEGSFLIKENDRYYMMYSANYFAGENYAVGYATANAPLGKYRKSASNPILEKNTDKGGMLSGTGHNSLFRDRNGKLLCVYHGRTTKTGDERIVFISEVSFDANNELKIATPIK